MLNRAPTLQPLGIQAFEAGADRRYSYPTQTHCSAPPSNADFDGETYGKYNVPRPIEAQ